MISEPTKMTVGKMQVDVNFNDAVTPCKKIRFRLGDKEAVVDREDLYALLMLFGDDKQQEELIPVVETKVRAITRLLKVRTKKDMKRGDIIAFPYTYYVPSGVYEKLLLTPGYNSADKAPDLSSIVNKRPLAKRKGVL